MHEAKLARRALGTRMFVTEALQSAKLVSMRSPEPAFQLVSVSDLTQLASRQAYRTIDDICEGWASSKLQDQMVISPGNEGSLAGSCTFSRMEYNSNEEVGYGISLDPENASVALCLPLEAWLYYLAALRMLDRTTEAKAYIDELDGVATAEWVQRERRILSALELRSKGDELQKNRDYRQAMQRYNESLEQLDEIRLDNDPSHPVLVALVHYEIASCYNETGEMAVAIECLNLALKTIPEHMDALQLRASCTRALHRYKDSIADCEAFISLYNTASTSRNGFPEIARVTFPGMVEKTEYERVKDGLPSLYSELENCPFVTADATRPPPPPSGTETGSLSCAGGSGVSTHLLLDKGLFRLSHKRVKPNEETVQAFKYFGLDWKHAPWQDLKSIRRKKSRDLHPDNNTVVDTTEAFQELSKMFLMADRYLSQYHSFNTLGLRMDCMSVDRVDAAYERRIKDGSIDFQATQNAYLEAKTSIARAIVGFQSDDAETNSESLALKRQSFAWAIMSKTENEAFSFLEQRLRLSRI